MSMLVSQTATGYAWAGEEHLSQPIKLLVLLLHQDLCPHSSSDLCPRPPPDFEGPYDTLNASSLLRGSDTSVGLSIFGGTRNSSFLGIRLSPHQIRCRCSTPGQLDFVGLTHFEEESEILRSVASACRSFSVELCFLSRPTFSILDSWCGEVTTTNKRQQAIQGSYIQVRRNTYKRDADALSTAVHHNLLSRRHMYMPHHPLSTLNMYQVCTSVRSTNHLRIKRESNSARRACL